MADEDSDLIHDMADLSKLGTLDDDVFEQIISTLSTSLPSPRISDLGEAVRSKSDGLEDPSSLLLTVIKMTLAGWMEREHLARLFEDGLDDISRLTGQDISLDDLPLIIERITRLAGCQAVQLAQLAMRMRRSDLNVFVDVDIVTDIRPVFESDLLMPVTNEEEELEEEADESPAVIATLRRHNLIIRSKDRHSNEAEYAVVLDDEDLLVLASELKKAMSRRRTLLDFDELGQTVDISLR